MCDLGCYDDGDGDDSEADVMSDYTDSVITPRIEPYLITTVPGIEPYLITTVPGIEPYLITTVPEIETLALATEVY